MKKNNAFLSFSGTSFMISTEAGRALEATHQRSNTKRQILLQPHDYGGSITGTTPTSQTMSAAADTWSAFCMLHLPQVMATLKVKETVKVF